MQHHPGSESGVPNPSGPQLGEESRPPEKVRNVEEGKRDSGVDTAEHTSSPASPSSEHADEEEDSASHEDSPEPNKSSPCTCRCGGCCCHGTSDPQHCVRCHTNYTFNHSQACMVPHVFASSHLESSDSCRDVSVRSVCCGHRVFGGEPVKGDWEQPFPCFMGWHTTDVDVVYNGVNLLRCDLGPGGKCRRTRMKHRAHYQNLFDDGVKYKEIDKEDHRRHKKRKREEDPQFGMSEEEEEEEEED
jgi:hypothetical protein